MEYRKKCNVCGKVFCYSDKDLKNNTLNSAMSAVSAIGSLASIFGGGTIFHTAHLNNQTNRYADKVVDINKCPYCNSSNVSFLSDEEWKKLQEGSAADGTAQVSGVAAIKASINAGATTESLLRRAALFLEDEDWDSANAYCDACLDKEPENAGAYLGKMLAELKVHSLKELEDIPQPFDENPYYKKTVRFADDELKSVLSDILTGIKERIRTEKMDARYEEACKEASSKKIAEVKVAIGIFRELGDWRDAMSKTSECEERIRALEKAEHLAQEKAAKQKEAERKAVEEEKKKRRKVLAISSSSIVALVLICIFLFAVVIPRQKHNKAMRLIQSGDYESAYALLKEIGDSEAIVSNKYDRAVALIDDGIYDEAYHLLEEIGNREAIASSKYDRAIAMIDSKDYETAFELLDGLDYKNSDNLLNMVKNEIQLSEAKVGTVVSFGAYEQDNDSSNGKETINWFVLARENNTILVVSEKGLDCKSYNASNESATWESCTLRKWLNESFLNAAFSPEEQNRILNSVVKADKNPDYSTPSGNDTTDKVFLLSVSEVNKYLSNDRDKRCVPTDFAKSNGAWKGAGYGTSYWWLRTPGNDLHNVSFLDTSGQVKSDGCSVDSANISVRPAIWINLDRER